MSDDRDLDDILRLVDEPLALRGDREDALLSELLEALDYDTTPGPETDIVTSEAEVIELNPAPQPATIRPRLSSWVLRAAIVVVLAGVVWLAQTGTDDGVTGQAYIEATTPTPVPTPRFVTIAEACTAFIEAAPDRDGIVDAVAVTPDEATQLFDAFDAFFDEMQRRTDVGPELTQDLRARRGVTVQLRASVADGESGWPSFEEFDTSLRLLSEADDRFANCWPT